MTFLASFLSVAIMMIAINVIMSAAWLGPDDPLVGRIMPHPPPPAAELDAVVSEPLGVAKVLAVLE